MKNHLLKKAMLFSFCLLTSAFLLQAQAPQGIPYQAIARNASGVAIANTAVKVRFSIRDSIATGSIKYQETHNPTTSALGLFSVNVGMGTVVSGTFSGINWGKNAKFLQVELDPAGGDNYTDLGTTQMMSVPYAIYSANSGNGMVGGTAQGQMMYWNGAEWMMVSPGSQGQNLTFCNGVPTWGPCPANEIPIVSTDPISTITSGGAISGGFITSTGGGTIISAGVCWGTNPNPNILENSRTIDNFESGGYVSRVSVLSPSTTYYLRSYAINTAGTNYGNQLVFRTPSEGVQITDIEGNSYPVIAIGNQFWLGTNLKVTKYRNGETIPTSIPDWRTTTSGAYAIFEDNPSNAETFGYLYNWRAVSDPRGLCPVGWHVPNETDWDNLAGFLGGSSNAGARLKAISGLWYSPNYMVGCGGESGFDGLPGGKRIYLGGYQSIFNEGYWWTSSSNGGGDSWYRSLSNSTSTLFRSSFPINSGLSIRCIKD